MVRPMVPTVALWTAGHRDEILATVGFRRVTALILVTVTACGSAPSSAPVPTTPAPVTPPSVVSTPAVDVAVDQVIDDIAEGFNRFRSDATELEPMVLNWAYAGGTYRRVADNLRAGALGEVPVTITGNLATVLTDAADGLQSATECVANGLKAGSGPEVCRTTFDAASTAHTMIAVALGPLIPLGTRPFPEVLALFS
jgi:hypothetical protein